MNCNYCGKSIHAFTGFQEVQKFSSHLQKCRKNPNNLRYGKDVAHVKHQGIKEALEIRSESGQ